MSKTPALLILLEQRAAERWARELAALGIAAEAEADRNAVLGRLSEGQFATALIDWDGAASGELVRGLMSRHPDLRVIALAEDSLTAAVEAMKAGAWDVLPRTADGEAVAAAFRRAMDEDEQGATPMAPNPQTGLLGDSRPMLQVRETIRRAAGSNATVLIRGESGTGKELVARAIHEASRRAHAPLVKVHCAALPESLIESELFGYEKGAFTGATARKLGRVDVAERGTLFLDEIGDIPLTTQVKLLRLLQEKQYERLGSTETLAADVRFIAATHRDLEDMVTRREFREDLFYRLNVVPLWLPPLRIRHGDVERLAIHFCVHFGKEHGRSNATLSPAALELLRTQRWPGNVRQLQNFVERLVVLSDHDQVTESDVTRELAQGVPFPTLATKARPDAASSAPPAPAPPAPASTTSDGVLPMDEEIRRAEKKALVRALERARGNRTLAARLLGVGRATLYKKMEEYGVS